MLETSRPEQTGTAIASALEALRQIEGPLTDAQAADMVERVLARISPYSAAFTDLLYAAQSLRVAAAVTVDGVAA